MAAVSGCGGGGSSPTSPSPSTPAVSSLAITGYASPFTAIGQTASLKLMATMTAGGSQDVTESATWTSDATGVATVSAAGVVTAVSNGDATISGTYQGRAATQRVTVTLPKEATPALTGRLEVTRSPEPAYWFRSMVTTTFSETGGSVGYSVNFINVAWYDYQDKLILFHNYNPGQLAAIWGSNYIAAGSSQGIRTWIDYTRVVSETTAKVEISITDDFGNTRSYNAAFTDSVSLTAPAGTRDRPQPSDAARSGGTEPWR